LHESNTSDLRNKTIIPSLHYVSITIAKILKQAIVLSDSERIQDDEIYSTNLVTRQIAGRGIRLSAEANVRPPAGGRT